jgi:hypothetical protein
MEVNALRTGRAAVVLTGVIAAFLAAAAQSQHRHHRLRGRRAARHRLGGHRAQVRKTLKDRKK